MKFKTPSMEYVKISLDRLTRFKPAGEKYKCVIDDILNRHVIGLKLPDLSVEEKTDIAAKIINSVFSKKSDFHLNEIFKEDEKKVFYLSHEDEIYLNSKIDFEAALENFALDKLPLNLRKLKLQGNLGSEETRRKFATLYPVSKVVLVEGITEEILLSRFAKILKSDFKKTGIFVFGAGGKNQVARKYYKLAEEIKIPIFVLLDFDADETCEIITPKLRAKDKIYKIKSGEFEDILPKNLIKNALDFRFAQNLITEENKFKENGHAVDELNECYRKNGWGDFKKADFAKIIEEYLDLTKNPPISEELQTVVKLIDEEKK